MLKDGGKHVIIIMSHESNYVQQVVRQVGRVCRTITVPPISDLAHVSMIP